MKRKKRLTVKKVLLYIVIGIIILIGILILNSKQLQKMPYSFKNTGYFGSALFYDTLEALGYEVSYEISPIHQIDSESLVVINAASISTTLKESDFEVMFDYVKKGGKLLVVSLDSRDLQLPNQLSFDSKASTGPFKQWTTKADGVLLYGEIYSFDNLTVSTERSASYETLKGLHPYINEDGIVFNEFYLFVQDGKRSLWREIPIGIKYTFYQLLLLIIIYIAYKGKRFGAPLTLYEEVEPDEHQYAKAVGELYYQAGHWEVLVEVYYHQLLNKIYRKHLLYTDLNESNWVEIFDQQKTRKIALKVFQFMKQFKEDAFKDYTKKQRSKKIKEILVSIQNLEKSLDQ